jgi:hypothetical protein
LIIFCQPSIFPKSILVEFLYILTTVSVLGSSTIGVGKITTVVYLVDEACRETNAIGSPGRQKTKEFLASRTEIPELCMPGLLAHPRVEMIWPDISSKDGHLDGLIQINTSEYYGVINVYVTLEDEQGNRLESDYALDNEVVRNHWGYFPSAPAAPGTTILVRAIALDCLGGVGIHTERVTI